MLRVALSIKAGRITASTLLRKLSTYSRKNRLYQAFRELGRAIRTGYLMNYIGDEELKVQYRQLQTKANLLIALLNGCCLVGKELLQKIIEMNREKL